MSLTNGSINLWRQLHLQGYFLHHPCYTGGTKDDGWSDTDKFEQMTGRRLDPEGVAAIIGCGYGRESKGFVRLVSRVYGIDVSPLPLKWAKRFVDSPRFVPVMADNYKQEVPDVDYVYSVSVFQHIPHNITIDYVETFKAKLKPGGAMVMQFRDYSCLNAPNAQPEPAYSWSRCDLEKLFGASARIETEFKKQTFVHYVHYDHPE